MNVNHCLLSQNKPKQEVYKQNKEKNTFLSASPMLDSDKRLVQ